MTSEQLAGRARETRQEAPDALIQRARHDRAAFGELYDHYLPRVFTFCRMYSASREEAEDLTAQTFERALAAIERYEARGAPFSLWLLRIASNAAIDRARRSGRTVQVEEGWDVPHLDGRLEEWTRAFWLRGHVEALPQDQREVVRQRFYEDRSFADIARRMQRSEGAVKQLLRRALGALSRRIQDEVHDE
jgi:RNA polymerase sigma-70 factor (ECF subfamily)